MLRMSGTSLEGQFRIILKARCFPGVWDKSLTVSARWGKKYIFAKRSQGRRKAF